MFAMFNQIFAAIATLFEAANRGANALNHLATVAEESAAAMSDQSRFDRQAKLAKLVSEGKAAAPVIKAIAAK